MYTTYYLDGNHYTLKPVLILVEPRKIILYMFNIKWEMNTILYYQRHCASLERVSTILNRDLQDKELSTPADEGM